MTRESDMSPGNLTVVRDELRMRATIANNSRVDRFISVHVNAGGGKGTEVYTGSDKAFAQTVGNHVASLMDIHGTLVKDGSGLSVIHNTVMPAILVEVGYIDSSDVDKILANIDTLALLIFKGICEFYKVDSSIPQPQPASIDYEAEIIRIKVDGVQKVAVTGLTKAINVAKSDYSGYIVLQAKVDGKEWDLGVVNPPALQPQPEAQPAPAPFVGTAIVGKSVATVNQCNQFIRSKNPNAPLLAEIYFQMEAIYGVRADIAFAQMCKETKYQMFGGDVSSEQHNPAGLGAVGDGVAGASFVDWSQGIEAQFQHLFSYSSTNALPYRPIVDPRQKYVHRGVAPLVEWLGIQENPEHSGWAVDPGYGYSILKDYLAVILTMPDVPIVALQQEVKPVKPQSEPTPAPEQPAPAVEERKPEPVIKEAPKLRTWQEKVVKLVLHFILELLKKLGGGK